MSKPHVILALKASIDSRYDPDNPMLALNRLEEERIQKTRSTTDAILTNASKIAVEDPQFPGKNEAGELPVVIVDRNVETPPDSRVFSQDRKIILLTTKTQAKYKIRRLQEAKPNLIVMEAGEQGIDLEESLWELHKSKIRRIMLEGDISFNMHMLKNGFVDELYLLITPYLLGEAYPPVFNARLERDLGLHLEGIMQYGHTVVLHYSISRKSR
jgi:2,5-diamino-6-(ribosylamino)-4(3H)-pyrimidinone 5'-phosphate reductase